VIVPQDEFMLQSMLGVDTIPDDIADEYLKRIRYLHRATSGGPMGPGMLIDVLRFLDYEPISGTKTPEGQTDWRSVKIGTRVNVRRAGRWTLATAVCRFAGFVDSGTLAVELPGGRVDEFMRHDVRIAASDMPPELDAASFEHKEGLQDVRLERNAKIELLDGHRNDLKPEVAAIPEDLEQGGMPPDDDPICDNVSQELVSQEIATQKPEAQKTDDLPVTTDADWKAVKQGTAVYAWITAPDGEPELHDATFQRRLKNGKIAVVVNGEEAERFLLSKDCRLP
jgi:hypothetical protein